MTNNNLKSDPPSNKQSWYKSPWLIGWLSLVLIVMAVNAYMISQSINDFPGLVVDDFYDRGQDYEENIHQKLENNQKWTTQFQLVDMHINKPTIINFSIKGKEGKPAEVEQITLFAYRPSDAKKDFSVAMKLIDKHTYQANITFNSKGNWDLLASVVISGTEVNYAKKIFVKD
jgi:nitrogen fixation protein FixH